MTFSRKTIAIAATLLAAASAHAQVTLDNKVMKQTVIRAADGTQRTTTGPARTLAPGNTAVYVMTYRNGGAKPASNLVISNKVPKDVIYAGAEGVEPEVSVDEGRTFSPIARAQVRAAGGAMRPAQLSDVNFVRWVIAGPVAPGSSGSVSYKGTVR